MAQIGMILVLTITALITATISGILGTGGGILLLAAMFCFLPFEQAIPLHAAVQLISNGSRIIAFRSHVDGKTFGRYSLGVVPGAMIALLILWSLGDLRQAQPYLKILIGVYILTLTFLRSPQGSSQSGRKGDFSLLGLAAGSAALLVGSVGPLIAPLFIRRNFTKERLIATKATCQMLTHVLKIAAFGVLGTIAVSRFTLLWAAMSAATVPGAFLGRRLLQHVSPKTFVMFYRVALSVAGLKILIFDGCLKLLGWL